jgi:pseudouridine synthase
MIQSSTPQQHLPQARIFTVGRLDKDTSGLILLTSDGRLPNAVLRGEHKQPKTYRVQVDKVLTERALKALASGVVITTEAQRDRTNKILTARTKPCLIEQLAPKELKMTIVEGRNRQVRKMLESIGYRVVKLHRTHFAGLTLSGLKPRQWESLNREEMKVIQEAIHQAKGR